MKQRAFVVTINVTDDGQDIDVANDIFDAVEGIGYPVITVNPFGGESDETVTANGPTPPEYQLDPLAPLGIDPTF